MAYKRFLIAAAVLFVGMALVNVMIENQKSGPHAAPRTVQSTAAEPGTFIAQAEPDKFQPEKSGDLIVTMLLVIAGLGVYFLPCFVAGQRKIKSSGGVFVVNFFLGWTFIGWVVALAWAASGESQPKTA